MMNVVDELIDLIGSFIVIFLWGFGLFLITRIQGYNTFIIIVLQLIAVLFAGLGTIYLLKSINHTIYPFFNLKSSITLLTLSAITTTLCLMGINVYGMLIIPAGTKLTQIILRFWYWTTPIIIIMIILAAINKRMTSYMYDVGAVKTWINSIETQDYTYIEDVNEKIQELQSIKKSKYYKDVKIELEETENKLKEKIKKIKNEILKINTSERQNLLNNQVNPKFQIKASERQNSLNNQVNPDIITLDLEQDVHSKKGLSVEEQNFLCNYNYSLHSFVDIDKIKQEEFYVKERHPESPAHVFLVYKIKELLENKLEKVERYYTKKADLIFNNKKGERIALEIETGKQYKKHKKRIDEKFERLKKEFGDNIFIVLTDSLKKKCYTKYGLKILLRKNISGFIQKQFS